MAKEKLSANKVRRQIMNLLNNHPKHNELWKVEDTKNGFKITNTITKGSLITHFGPSDVYNTKRFVKFEMNKINNKHKK